MTTTEKLINIISSVLPNAKETGMINHLWANFHPANKGKAITFVWKKAQFRLTANLKVQEIDFTNSLTETNESKEIEKLIKTKVTA